MSEQRRDEKKLPNKPGQLVCMALEGAGSPTKACVIGIEKTGRTVASALLDAGISIVVIEENPDEKKAKAASELESRAARSKRSVRFAYHQGTTSQMDPSLLDGATLVIPSPGVPKNAPALDACRKIGCNVWSEVELAYRIVSARRLLGDTLGIVAVTGTNGKTTTVRLIEHVLEATGKSATACGNIGLPFTQAALSVPSGTWLVVEVSSFQLAFCESFRPDVSVFLNFAPDHLDWHPDIDDYAASKAKIFARQDRGDTAVYNATDPQVKHIAKKWIREKVRRIPFAVGSECVIPGGVGVFDEGKVEFFDGTTASCELLGKQGGGRGRKAGAIPAEDVAAALAASIGCGLDPEEALIGVSSFVPLSHRLESVAEVSGREFVNDSKATNPHAVQAAVSTYESVVLIAGGRNKGIDLGSYASAIAATGRIRTVVCIGESGPVLARAFGDLGIETLVAASMDEAVEAAWKASSPGDTILLSPGCASFDWYRNYEERGDHFKRVVRNLAASPTVAADSMRS